MTETLLSTSIPIYVVILFILGLFLVGLEIGTNFKGILAIMGGLCTVIGIILCLISGVPTIEITFLLVVFAIIIMLMLNSVGDKGALIVTTDKIVMSNILGSIKENVRKVEDNSATTLGSVDVGIEAEVECQSSLDVTTDDTTSESTNEVNDAI